MTLDQYSYCPCGNGKKIKFCKCHEHLQEMQTIHRMIVGEQNVAALDRINADLKTMPSEPWLLAMKCDLLLNLSELELLEETSAKFIRLQPDNPLAKLYRSLVAVVRGNTEEGSSLMLQAISEAKETLPPITATVAINLIEMMGQRGMTLSALLHSEMLLDMGEAVDKIAQQVYQSVVGQTAVNVLVRESLPSGEDASDEPYAERLAEADALISNYRISVAKTKLESIQREFGLQEPVLRELLYCQLMLTDIESAAVTCRKISELESVPVIKRVYYKALSYELNPRGMGVALNEELCQYVIEDSEFEQRLTTNPHLVPLQVEQLRNVLDTFVQEEVPPKFAFLCTSDVLREQFPEQEARRGGGWLAYYGKQTDKPARLIVLETTLEEQRVQLEHVKQELGLNVLPRELLRQIPLAYLGKLDNSIVVKNQIPDERRDAFDDAVRLLLIDRFLDIKLEALGGNSPRTAASDPKNAIALQALLLHWQASGTSGLEAKDFKAIHQTLGLTQFALPSTDDLFDSVGAAAYFWTDLTTIDAMSLIQLMQSALNRGVNSIYPALVSRSEQIQWPEELAQSAEYTRLNLKTRVARDPNEAEVLLKQIVDSGRKLGLPIGNAVLERVDVLNMLGRNTEARHFLESSLKENPNDPVLLEFIQMIMLRQQQAAARGRASGPTPSSAPANSSGLWTPDQGLPTDEPTGGAGGGSKLWIPGQD